MGFVLPVDLGCVCKVRTQDPENFHEEVKSLATAWWIRFWIKESCTGLNLTGNILIQTILDAKSILTSHKILPEALLFPLHVDSKGRNVWSGIACLFLCVSNSYGRYFLEPTIESLLSDLWNSLLTSHIFHQSKEFLSELQWKYATARNWQETTIGMEQRLGR